MLFLFCFAYYLIRELLKSSLSLADATLPEKKKKKTQLRQKFPYDIPGHRVKKVMIAAKLVLVNFQAQKFNRLLCR